MLNAKIPIPSLRLHEQEVIDVLQNMILHGEIVAVSEKIYLPRVFAQEDETARQIAMRVVEPSTPERIEQILERVKREMGLALSSKQEAAVHAASVSYTHLDVYKRQAGMIWRIFSLPVQNIKSGNRWSFGQEAM